MDDEAICVSVQFWRQQAPLVVPGRERIEANVTGTSPTMRNIPKPALMVLSFPLPPTDVQSSLITKLTCRRKGRQAPKLGSAKPC